MLQLKRRPGHGHFKDLLCIMDARTRSKEPHATFFRHPSRRSRCPFQGDHLILCRSWRVTSTRSLPRFGLALRIQHFRDPKVSGLGRSKPSLVLTILLVSLVKSRDTSARLPGRDVFCVAQRKLQQGMGTVTRTMAKQTVAVVGAGKRSTTRYQGRMQDAGCWLTRDRRPFRPLHAQAAP